MTDTRAPRELFPLTMSGPKTVVQSIDGTRNPDGTRAGTPVPSTLEEVPEPTVEELAAMEAASAGQSAEDAVEAALEAAGGVPEPMPDPNPDLADAVGKGKGAAAKA